MHEYFYMVTMPNETTDPGRESETSLRSSSETGGFGVGVDATAESGTSKGNICLELLRGGGDNDVISNDWSMCCKALGGGKEDIVGVSNCKKLGSSWKDIICSLIGVGGFGIKEARVGLGD